MPQQDGQGGHRHDGGPASLEDGPRLPEPEQHASGRGAGEALPPMGTREGQEQHVSGQGAGEAVPAPAGKRPLARSPVFRGVLAVLLLALFVAFVSLGTWQVHRRAWKLDLIARVDARMQAAPVPLVPPQDWPTINRNDDEYRQVRVRGTFRHQDEAFVQASTVLGAGYWVLTPLEMPDGHIVFINRGFVPPEYRAEGKRHFDRPAGLVDVSGLLRLTEPKGGFLRDNDPAADRWYSRDIDALARSRRLGGQVAPFFIDQALPVRSLASLDAPADDTERWRPPPAGADELALSHWMASQHRQLPMPGLTVVTFANSHLSYIFTWYSLAALVVFAAWKMLWQRPAQK